MAAGEFEYVKPPHFYVEDAPKLDVLRLTKDADMVNSTNLNESQTVPETETVVEQSEIEIEIDDETSTTKIVVKETSKPTRGRTPKLGGLEQEIADKYKNGGTLKELGEEYGVSVPCVSNALKRAGETVRSRGRKKKTV